LLSRGEKRVAWVTGASGDIGSAICDALTIDNWLVVRITRDDLDLSNVTATKLWVKNNQVESPDLVVCNAAGNVPGHVLQLTSSDFEFWLHNNFLGHVEIVQSVIHGMKSRSKGDIIFVSSAYATRSRIGRSQYSVSKAAQDAYMRGLALELAPYGIKSNSVSPGFVETKLTRKNNSKEQIADLISKVPIGRLGTPSEVAKLITFLASDENSYITGQNIAIDGGFLLQ